MVDATEAATAAAAAAMDVAVAAADDALMPTVPPLLLLLLLPPPLLLCTSAVRDECGKKSVGIFFQRNVFCCGLLQLLEGKWVREILSFE